MTKAHGFTIVELMIVIAVIGILATIVTVGFTTVKRDAANSSVVSSLKNAGETVEVELINNRKLPLGMPDSFAASEDVMVTYIPDEGTIHYSDLTPVQNGVLFYNICLELISDPFYSTIHSRDGNSTRTVMLGCHVYGWQSVHINGWDSRNWSVPLTSTALQSYVNSVPYDDWWIDKQQVTRSFYTELMSRFTERGGTWPVTSFWDTWASGVQKEILPEPDPSSDLTKYCIVAYSSLYPEISYFLTADDQRIRSGNCDSTS